MRGILAGAVMLTMVGGANAGQDRPATLFSDIPDYQMLEQQAWGSPEHPKSYQKFFTGDRPDATVEAAVGLLLKMKITPKVY